MLLIPPNAFPRLKLRASATPLVLLNAAIDLLPELGSSFAFLSCLLARVPTAFGRSDATLAPERSPSPVGVCHSLLLTRPSPSAAVTTPGISFSSGGVSLGGQ